MARQERKSILGSQVDTDILNHANDETTYGIIKLPPGIIAGRAQVTECYFAVHEKGKHAGKVYFRASASVLEPESFVHNGTVISLKGAFTSIILPWDYAKGKDGTIEKSKARVMNELRKIAGDKTTSACRTGEEIEALAQAIEDAGPVIGFTTTESKPPIDPETGQVQINPETGKPFETMVWENWQGTRGLENYVNGSSSVKATKDRTTQPINTQHNGVSSSTVNSDDWDTIAKDAVKNRDSALKMEHKALSLGYTQEEIDECSSWTTIAEWIKSGPKTTSLVKWEYGDDYVCKYAPENKKSPGTKLDPVDVEVASVDEENQTVNLINITNRRLKYNDVSWSELLHN